MHTQVELERMMHSAGMIRSKNDFDRAEEHGYASRCPYTTSLVKDYVPPIAEAIANDTRHNPRGAGVLKKHVTLLRELDSYAVAYIAVAGCVSFVMRAAQEKSSVTYKALARNLGGLVHDELVAAQIAEQNLELFVSVSKELKRRHSQKVRHRMAHLRHAATKAGVTWNTWAVGDAEHVGFYLVRLLSDVGFLIVDESNIILRGKTEDWEVTITPAVEGRIRRMRYLAGVFHPAFGPCSEPPKPWVSLSDGGWHTNDLRKALPFVVRCRPNAREEVRVSALRPPLDALNYAQNTGWRVNTRLLQVARDMLARGIHSKEVLSPEPPPAPSKPWWLENGMRKQDLPEDRLKEFGRWKYDMSEWHTQNKLRSIRVSRMASTLRVAEFFKDYPAIHYVHFFCSRGRMYPLGGVLNPQGSDFNKGLLEFYRGVEYTEGSRGAFHIRKQVANLWGIDKAPHVERIAWVEDNMSLLLRVAADPLENTDWLQADKPWQFLQCVMELAELVKHKRVVGRAVVSFDGSCNGLQHLSAMARDAIGGALVNLVPNERKQDIYAAVAADTANYVRTLDDPLAALWLARGIDRAVMKQPVMTIPYNVTFLGARDQILKVLRQDTTPMCTDLFDATTFLAKALWQVRKDGVLSASIILQQWMERSVKAIVEHLGDDAVVRWDTPSGFPATQVHQQYDTVRVNVRSVSGRQIRINTSVENEKADVSKHKLSFPPNFLHSIDASHMHMVSVAAEQADIPLRLVHDDYGSHAANGDATESLVKREFVNLHRHRPLEMLRARYPMIPEVPKYGTLDIEAVRESVFSFD